MKYWNSCGLDSPSDPLKLDIDARYHCFSFIFEGNLDANLARASALTMICSDNAAFFYLEGQNGAKGIGSLFSTLCKRLKHGSDLVVSTHKTILNGRICQGSKLQATAHLPFAVSIRHAFFG